MLTMVPTRYYRASREKSFWKFEFARYQRNIYEFQGFTFKALVAALASSIVYPCFISRAYFRAENFRNLLKILENSINFFKINQQILKNFKNLNRRKLVLFITAHALSINCVKH